MGIGDVLRGGLLASGEADTGLAEIERDLSELHGPVGVCECAIAWAEQ